MISNPNSHPLKSTSEKDSFSDESLWKSFKDSNELAFTMIYKKYVQRLYNYGMHACKNHEMVTDCVQDLFSDLWKKREKLALVQLVKPYLFTSFRRLLIQRITQQRKEVTFTSWGIQSFEFTPSIESTIIEDDRQEEQRNQLKSCIESLTKNQREIIYLKFFNELSYQEIADITDIQVNSVYNLVSKTIELLRKKMQVIKPLHP